MDQIFGYLILGSISPIFIGSSNSGTSSSQINLQNFLFDIDIMYVFVCGGGVELCVGVRGLGQTAEG
jgi:hypothetical protein